MPENIFDERPTVESLMGLRAHLEGVWAAARANWVRWEDFYWQDNTIWPKALQHRPTSRKSTASYTVDRATDTQLGYDPIVRRRKNSSSLADERNADRIEPWLREALVRTMRKETQHPGRLAGHFLMLLGYAPIYGPVPDMENYVREPERDQYGSAEEHKDALAIWENSREDWSPFILRTLHPTQVLLDPREKQPSYGLRIQAQFAGDLFHQVEKRKRRRLRQVGEFSRRSNPFEEIEVIEFFSRRWHTVMTEEEGILFTEMNRMGFVPFAHGYSGYGAPRSSTGISPENLAIGVLGRIENALIREGQEVSAVHNVLMNKAFAPMGTRLSAEDVATQLKGGGIIEGVTPDDLWWWQFPNVGGDLFQQREDTSRDIEKGTFNLMAAGFREAGVRTLGEMEILSKATNLKFVAPGETMNDLFSIIGANMLRLVDFLGERVKAAGYEIGSREIGKRYSVDVSFEVVDPQLRLAEKQQWMAEYQSGLKSKRSYWQASGTENASEEEDRMAEDRLEAHPAFVTAHMAKVAEEKGLDDLAKRLRRESDEALLIARQEMQGGGNAGEVPIDEARPAYD